MQSLSAILGPIRRATSLSGGCIHRAARLETANGVYFAKCNSASHAAAFAAEAFSLRAIAATQTIRVPEVIWTGVLAGQAFLVLEYIELSSTGSQEAAFAMGRQLACLHALPQPHYGWPQDNFIGPTPQPNGEYSCWATFFAEQRLRWQLDLLARTGVRFRNTQALFDRLPAWLEGANLRPALLHGDLWGGNAGFAADGQPVLFDPACYFGHAEADLAMTRLFGGFGRAFYDGYAEVLPPAPGHEQRCTLYNLYHLLNHALLFGGGYQRQCQAAIDQLCRPC